jgi:Spy/CpxP family protein refolding chaperone
MMKRLAMFLIIVTLCLVASFAQGRRGGFGGGRARGGPVQMDERTALDLLAVLLNLSDAQQQQLRTVFDAAVKAAAPIATQMASDKEAVVEAVKAGKSDAQVKTLAGQQASLSSQMLTLQAQTFAKMWAILRSDQKSHVDASMYDDIGALLSNTKPPILPGSVPASNPEGPAH